MTQQTKTTNWVKDQLSQKHRLTKELGRGGQGVVYQTSDPQLLVKMVLRNYIEITDKAEIKQFQAQLERLYLLPLSETMHITKPLYLLEDHAGYVMQMMQDMQPIGEWLPKLFKQKASEGGDLPDWFPSWLDKNLSLEIAYPLAMYAKSGGTKRRLELLAQAAIELLKLHSVGVVYMDISPENIFCSKTSAHSEVWLIDADNLRFEAIHSKTGALTPQYAAPEIVRGESGARVISDAYSLSLLAFKLLSMSNAFDGHRFVDNVEEDDWAVDDIESSRISLDEQAERGMLPFILDADDASNCQKGGLPKDIVFTPELLAFFRKMFGEGRIQPWRRPSLYSFPRILAKAADHSISCVCGMSYYYQPSKADNTCPYCKNIPAKLLVANSYFYTQQGVGEPIWTWVSQFDENEDLKLPRRLADSFEFDKHSSPLFEISHIENDSFIYASAEDMRIDIANKDGEFCSLSTQWLLEKSELEEGIQLYVHAPYSVIIEIKVLGNNAI